LFNVKRDDLVRVAQQYLSNDTHASIAVVGNEQAPPTEPEWRIRSWEAGSTSEE